MTAEVSKLLNNITLFIKTVESNRKLVDTLMEKLEKNIVILGEQLEVYSVSRRASVPASMLKSFPDVKQRLLSSLHAWIEEEMVEITGYINQLSELSEEFRKLYYKIEGLLTQIKWKDYMVYYNAFNRIMEWADRCWKYFHLICIHFRNGLTAVILDGTYSNTHLKFVDAVDGIDKDYVFNNPVINMFQMLKIDFSSRSKITVKSLAVS